MSAQRQERRRPRRVNLLPVKISQRLEVLQRHQGGISARPDDAGGVLQAPRRLWKRAISPFQVIKQPAGSALRLRPRALLLSLAMNGFYGMKALRGNLPVEFQMEEQPEYAQVFKMPFNCMVKPARVDEMLA